MKVPLRALLTIPFLLQIFGTVGIVGYLSFRNGQKAVKNVATQLSDEISDRVRKRIQLYLNTPHFVNQLNANAIQSGYLNLDNGNSRDLERYFCQQLKAFQSASHGSRQNNSELNESINNIYLGRFDRDRVNLLDDERPGYLFGAERAEDGSIKIMRADRSTDFKLTIFHTNEECKATIVSGTKKDFKLADRNWYTKARSSDRPIWSDIYLDASSKTPAIGGAQAVWDNESNPPRNIAVLGSDLLLEEVNEFLKSLKVGQTGLVFILNNQGNLISVPISKESRKEDKNWKEIKDKDKKTQIKLRTPEDSENFLISGAAKCLKEERNNKDSTTNVQLIDCRIDKSNHFLQVTPLIDPYGLNWKIAVVIPESDFMAEINKNSYFTIILCLLALGIATLFGLHTSKKIAKPINQLKDSANKLSKTLKQNSPENLSEVVKQAERDEHDIKNLKELNILAVTFLNMTTALKTAFTTLEETNQKLTRSKIELENTNKDLDRSKKELENTNKNLENVNRELQKSKAEIENTNLSLKHTNLNLEQARTQLKQTNQDLKSTNNAYIRFVPSAFIDLLNTNIISVELGESQKLEMSILFSDIRNFTTLSEIIGRGKDGTQNNFKFLNSYLKAMAPAIAKNKGFIDKYIGDAIMALFSTTPDDAVQAGIDMLQNLAEFNKKRGQNNRPKISIGIGIHTGDLMLGTVGSENRMDVTAIGDAVNLASRLEGLTKHFGVQLLISGETQKKLPQKPQHDKKYEQRCLGRVQVKGKADPVEIFEVYNNGDLQGAQKTATKPTFESALEYYAKGNFSQAQQQFEEVIRLNPEDGAVKFYIKRCQEYQEKGAPEGWNGVEKFDEK